MIYLNNNTEIQTINIPYSQPDMPVQKEVQSVKHYSVDEGGRYLIKPDSGFTSMEKVDLMVNVSSGTNVDIISTAMTVTRDVETIESEAGKAFSAVTVDATQFGNVNYSDGYDYAVRNVAVESVELPVSANGVYDATIGRVGEGYIRRVVVDVDQEGPYNSGYTSGFTDGMVSGTSVGYEEGVAEQKAKLTGIFINKNGQYSRPDGYSAVTVSVRPKWEPYVNNEYRYAKQMCYANDLPGYSFSGTYLCHLNDNQTVAGVDIDENGVITGYTGLGMVQIPNSDHFFKKDNDGYTWEAWVEDDGIGHKYLYWFTNADISELDAYGTGHGIEMYGYPLPIQ